MAQEKEEARQSLGKGPTCQGLICHVPGLERKSCLWRETSCQRGLRCWVAGPQPRAPILFLPAWSVQGRTVGVRLLGSSSTSNHNRNPEIPTPPWQRTEEESMSL